MAQFWFRSFVCALVVLGYGIAPAQEGLSDAERAVRRAKAEAGDPSEQALALVDLAWINQDRDAETAQLAREELILFGKYAIPAFRVALRKVPKIYTADVAAALIRCQDRQTHGIHPEFFAALETALWAGSSEAQRLVIPQLARFRVRTALLPAIDAAYERPSLTKVVVEALGVWGDDRARFYLGEVLRNGIPRQQEAAASVLAKIGGLALDTLREGTISEKPDVRRLAIDAMLPATGLDDLTALHEYIALYGDDDPELLERVRLRAIQLESLLERKLDADASSDF